MSNETSAPFPYPDEHFLDESLPKGYLSPSQVSLYWSCPKAYYYRYILGVKGVPSLKMVKGSVVHKATEITLQKKIDTGSSLPLDAATTLTADLYDDYTKDLTEIPKAEKGYVKDKTIDMFATYYREGIIKINPIAVEKRFAARLGDVPVCGIIDLIDEVPGVLELGDYSIDQVVDGKPPKVQVVCDLKTTAKVWSEQQLQKHVQFTVYSIVENNYRVRADFLIEGKKSTRYEPKRTLRTEKDRKQAIEDFQEVRELISKGIFPRTDPTSWKCSANYCDAYEMCRG
jgi:CRISPR/Cas system-associated exonuclease Cas4 (RecB family)